MTKWYGACSAYDHPLRDRDLARARSLAGPQCDHKLLGSVPGSRGGGGCLPGPGGQPIAQSAAVCSARTRHLLGLALLGLILEGAAPALGEALREEPGAPARVAGGAGSQLCSLPGAGVAPHLAWEGGKAAVGYGPKAFPRAQGKLKDNVEQSCNYSNIRCEWKSFLTTPDSRWESSYHTCLSLSSPSPLVHPVLLCASGRNETTTDQTHDPKNSGTNRALIYITALDDC